MLDRGLLSHQKAALRWQSSVWWGRLPVLYWRRIWWTDRGYHIDLVDSHTLSVPSCTSPSLHTSCSPRRTHRKLRTHIRGNRVCQTAPVSHSSLVSHRHTASIPQGDQDTWYTVDSSVCWCWSTGLLDTLNNQGQSPRVAMHQTQWQQGWQWGLAAEWSTLSCTCTVGPGLLTFSWRVLKGSEVQRTVVFTEYCCQLINTFCLQKWALFIFAPYPSFLWEFLPEEVDFPMEMVLAVPGLLPTVQCVGCSYVMNVGVPVPTLLHSWGFPYCAT